MPSKKRPRSVTTQAAKDVEFDPNVFGTDLEYGTSNGSAVDQSSAASHGSRKSDRVAEQHEQTSRTQKRFSKSQQRKMKRLAVSLIKC
jgi:hypothetical protein